MMSIDRIGKPPAPFDPAAADASQGTSTLQKSEFTLETLGTVDRSASAEQTQASTPLERLRSGEWTLAQYIDARIDDATQHLTHLPPTDLERIRDHLRDRLETSPALLRLVEGATGSPLSRSEP